VFARALLDEERLPSAARSSPVSARFVVPGRRLRGHDRRLLDVALAVGGAVLTGDDKKSAINAPQNIKPCNS
jgi:hypothetical protein